MTFNKEFLVELKLGIKALIAKQNFDWKKDYELKVMCRAVSDGMVKYCMLCDTTEDIICTGIWSNDNAKQNVVYFLCRDCADEFFKMPDDQRESIVAKVIEKRIDATPVIKL